MHIRTEYDDHADEYVATVSLRDPTLRPVEPCLIVREGMEADVWDDCVKWCDEHGCTVESFRRERNGR